MSVSEPRHWVRLTSACNNNCVFCLDLGARIGKVASFENVIRELKGGRKGGLKRVVLSGGEPTIHPRFLDIVRAAVKMGYTHVQAISNGRRFCYPDFLGGCVQAGLREITFSMHGHTRELHDKLVGIPGAFRQAVTGLVNALKRPELIISVDVCLNRLNIGRLEELLRFYINLGVREFDLLQVVPFARAWDNWDELSYDLEASGESLRKALALGRSMGCRLWTNRLGARHLEGFEDLIQSPNKLHDELRGRIVMFRDFLSKGSIPDCRGERCPHCFMEGFCEDLLTLRETGELRGKGAPKCVSKSAAGAPRRARFAWAGEDTDLSKFTQFFIDNRYFVKGKACDDCAAAGSCPGAHIELIRERGFGILNPKARVPAPRAKASSERARCRGSSDLDAAGRT